MGNTLPNRRKTRNSNSPYTPSIFGKQSPLERERKGNKQRYELRSKTLPARNRKSKNSKSSKTAAQTLPNHKLIYGTTASATGPICHNAGDSAPTPPPPNGETSRVLFLLYLIHRTWNVITDTKSKSSSHAKVSEKPSNRDSFYETESNYSLSFSDLYEEGGGGRADVSQCCSQYSLCSCSSCYNGIIGANKQGLENLNIGIQNVYNSIDEQFSQDSMVDKAFSICRRLGWKKDADINPPRLLD
uniref:Uncharacterized protein n=1 Tax=Stomoxys calcitrans TaxID=35570 RepID=A0A1I8Q326_STOCA